MLADKELANHNRATINRAAALGRLRIAAISVWETALLASRGRIVLSQPLSQWIEEAVSATGLSIEPLSSQVTIEGGARCQNRFIGIRPIG